MYEKGSLMIYDTTGVCRVEEIGVPTDLPVADKTKDYYKLAPVFGTGTIYIPVDTEVFMRPVISREEAEDLLRKIPDIEEDQDMTVNQKSLEESYKESFRSHNCEDLVKVIKTAYTRRKYLEHSGKKSGKTDLQYMKRAKKLLNEELSTALGITVDEASTYVEEALQENQ